jgi:protein AATF/BFR2
MAQEKHFNVDDAEEYDDGTRAVAYSDNELHSDSDNDATTTLSSSRKQRLQAESFRKTKQASERASALRVKNWDADALESASYAGKVVKRKDVSTVDMDEGMESPDDEAMADWSEAEPFGESEEEEEEDDTANDMGSDARDSDGEDDDADGEQDAETLIRSFQKQDSAQLMSSKDTAKLVEKATHVRNQKLIWERCLEIQIYTKRLLTTTKESAAAVHGSIEEDQKAALSEQLFSCIDTVSTLQDKLCNSAELSVEPRDHEDDESKTRKRSIEEVWSQINLANHEVLPQYNEILNTYSRKTNLAGGSQAKKFKAVNQDILAQVESVLADPQRVKRKAHAPREVPLTSEAVDSSNGHTTGEENDDDSSDQLDESMYDDSDFYQQLLKEFIESGGSSQDQLLRRTHRKKKKVVNRKASKGRVLRYTVHPKLENFMFPEPYPSSEMDVDELFRSIFGQARHA